MSAVDATFGSNFVKPRSADMHKITHIQTCTRTKHTHTRTHTHTHTHTHMFSTVQHRICDPLPNTLHGLLTGLLVAATVRAATPRAAGRLGQQLATDLCGKGEGRVQQAAMREEKGRVCAANGTNVRKADEPLPSKETHEARMDGKHTLPRISIPMPSRHPCCCCAHRCCCRPAG